MGDLNISVSLTMAAHKSPAVTLSISTPHSLYILYIMEQVDPMGTFLKNTGDMVSNEPSL